MSQFRRSIPEVAQRGHGPTLPRPRHARGQALVEFAMVLLPILLIVVGIVQFGFIFGANVSLTNATREAARAGTIHVYDGSKSTAQNGLDRCTAILGAATQAFGLLTASAPHFSSSSPCTMAMAADLNADGYDDRWTNGDLVVSLCALAAAPTSPCPNSSDAASYCIQTDGSGCLVRVELSYRSDVIVPLLDAIIDGDGDGRILQRGSATMVIN